MSSDFKFSECQQKSQPSNEDIRPFAGAMAEGAGIESCKTSSSQSTSQTELQGEAEADALMGLAGSMEMSFQAKTRTDSAEAATAGCEQVAIMAKRNLDTIEKIKCVMTQNQSAINIVGTSLNSIRFEVDDMQLLCSEGFNLNQRANVKVVSTNSFSDSQIQDITDTLVDTAKQNAETLLESKSGFGATPQGQKVLEDIVSKTQTTDYKQQVRQSVLSTTINLSAQNEVIFKGKKLILNSKKQCSINQDAALDIVATSMLNSVMQNTFKEYTEKVREQVSKLEGKSESAGFAAPPEDISFSMTGNQKMWTYIGIAAVVVIVLAIGAFFIFRSKDPSPPGPGQQAGMPPMDMGQGGMPPIDMGQGGMPPIDMGQGGMPLMDMGQGGMPPMDMGQGGMPPIDMGQGGMPPMDMGQGGMPPNQNQGTTIPLTNSILNSILNSVRVLTIYDL